MSCVFCFAMNSRGLTFNSIVSAVSAGRLSFYSQITMCRWDVNHTEIIKFYHIHS